MRSPLAAAPRVPGVELYREPCPKCGGRMFKKPCPCYLRRKGWLECARCMKPKCAAVIGIKRDPKPRRAKRRPKR